MNRRRRRKRLAVVLLVLLALALVVGVAAFRLLTRDEPVTFADPVEHFKYGSVGTEENQGVPLYIWMILPTVFADLLPEGEGDGYQRIGFLYEPGRDRPIGSSLRRRAITLAGLNCALCHTGTLRETPTSERRMVLGMPATRFRVQEYVDFLRAVGRDPRFDADTLMPAIERRFPSISHFERLLYRYYVIPETEKALRQLDEDFRWAAKRPRSGPGRVDTFNPWKVILELDIDADDTVGTADFPSIWNQRPREGMGLHWDGNNTRLLERNLSAALSVGASMEDPDLANLRRVTEWLLDLPPPRFPASRIDRALARRGEPLYDRACAACHDVGGSRVGQVTPIGELGTDRERLDSFTPELKAEFDQVGEGKLWHFRSYRKTDGYANQLLDGIWLRAPYLHNGAVPTLRALLFPEERPEVFYSGYDVYDWENLGFVSSGPQARAEGFRLDTRLRGNANGGHLYGTELSPADREAILEYLKTL